GWDVCLLPFARNDATRFISPTKTLEYMAAERPIVSTPITDVAEPYGHIVYLANDAGQFIERCGVALDESGSERRRRISAMPEVPAQPSRAEPARSMEHLISRSLRGKSDGRAAHEASSAQLARAAASADGRRTLRRGRGRSETPVVIVGAGP